MLAELLRAVMLPHSRLAARLLGLIQRPETEISDGSTQEFEAAAVIVFVAGIDKLLSLSLELLYLAGHVEWQWMQAGRRKADVWHGVFCHPGFAAKIDKLKQLGCDLTELGWFAVPEIAMFTGALSMADTESIRTSIKSSLIFVRRDLPCKRLGPSSLDFGRMRSTQ